MKNLLRIILISIFSLGTFLHAQDDLRNCKKRIKISGERNDGSGVKDTVMVVTQRFYDFTDAQLKKQLEDDKYRYEGFNYQAYDQPTMKMDCAGNTLHEVFLTGKYWITAEMFYNCIIKPYATKVSNSVSWGDAKESDIVVFFNDSGAPTHICSVSSVQKTMGVVSSITIFTKDGKEACYMHKMTLGGSGNDPLFRSMGTPQVFRINHETFDVNDAFYPDCKGMVDVKQ